MAISEEIDIYLSDFIKPLVTNQSLEEIFSKLKEEIVSKFEEKLERQINRTEMELERQANHINMLEGQIDLQKNISDQLEITCDNTEKHSRRTSIQIHGIEVPENESTGNVMAAVKSFHQKINIPFNIDRVH